MIRYQTLFLIFSIVFIAASLGLGAVYVNMYNSEEKPTQESANIGLASLILNWVSILTIFAFYCISSWNAKTSIVDKQIKLLSKLSE